MSTDLTTGTVVPAPARLYYPDSDGEPIADSDDQYEAMTDAKFALVNFFRDDPQVYVAANLLIYYQKGDPKKRVAPDVFVVRGAPKRRRRSYQLWREKQRPAIVIEIASPGTWEKDMTNQALYASLQIPEYVMFDWSGGDYFGDVLLGYRYVEGAYQPIPTLPSENDDVGFLSEQLGLEVWARRETADDFYFLLRFRNPQTGEWLLSQAESEAARRVEAAARAEAEARLAAVQAELDRLRAGRSDA